MRSYLRPSTHRRTSANTRFAGLRRVGRPPLSHRLRLVKSRMVPYHALHLCPPPRPDPLLSRLAAEPPPPSPASIAPLAVTSTAPTIPWLSEPLSPLLMKPVKHFCWVLLGYLPYLLSFGWGKNTSHRKWYYEAIFLFFPVAISTILFKRRQTGQTMITVLSPAWIRCSGIHLYCPPFEGGWRT